jgi:5-methylcytosine-specific restriction enzyme A
MRKYICHFPGCNTLINQPGYCEKHKKYEPKPFLHATRPNDKFYHTTAWFRLKNAQLKKVPYCEICGKTDNLQVHHDIPPRGNTELFFDPNNLRTVCAVCHKIITAKEIAERKNRL